MDYDGPLHRGYARGRALSGSAARAWEDTLATHLPPRRPLRVLDLGSGTGRLSPIIARAAGGPVIAVEPSAKMRAQAAAASPAPGVHYVGGRAEALPLAARSCDAVVMFFVLHHLADLGAAAREIARVLAPDGRVITIGSFGDRLHDRTYHRYVPRSRQVEADMFPCFDQVVASFAAAGLVALAHDQVSVELAPSLAAYSEKLRHRAVSALARLPEHEVSAGIRQLAADAHAERDPTPIHHMQDVLTLGLPPGG